MRNKLAYLPAGILLLGCLGLLKAHDQTALPLPAPMAKLLPAIEGYEVRDQTLGAEEQRIAGMDDYVARVYMKDSTPVFTTLVTYYESQSKGNTIHSPRNCLPGAGWDIMTAGRQVLDIDGRKVEINRHVLKNGPATALVLYWYQGRNRVVADEYAVKWNLLRDAALLGHTEESLVRIVVPFPTGTVGSAATDTEVSLLAEKLARQLIADVDAMLPARPTTGN